MTSSTIHVLVIDDEAALCEYVADIARGEGLEARSCTDGRQVKDALAQPAEVIFLDLMMPGMDGIEVLRMAADAGCRARIVLMSGVDRRVLQTAQRYGASRGLAIAAAVQKPVRAAELRALLKTAIEDGAAREVAAAPRTSTSELELADLERGIDAGELVVYYQPQVSLSDGAWVGVEGLVRWQHPSLGLVTPNRFIGLAERGGLALKLTRAVVARALAELPATPTSLGFNGTLSLNLPAVALTDLDFPGQMRDLASLHRWPDERIQFEITETSAGNDSASALDILTRLRMNGFRLSIDDFGTGHSSLERLRLLPFNELKIDMQFVAALEKDADSRVIVSNSVQLAHQLGMSALAEGVENSKAWELLRQSGCDFAQGYLISRPVPISALEAWHADWRRRFADMEGTGAK